MLIRKSMRIYTFLFIASLFFSRPAFGLLVVKDATYFVDSTSHLDFNTVNNQSFRPIGEISYLVCDTCEYWIRFRIQNNNLNKECNMLITNVVKEGQLYYFCPDDKKFVTTDRVGSGLPTPEYNTFFYPFLPFKLTNSSNYYYFRFRVIQGKLLSAYSTGFSVLADSNYLLNYSTRYYIYISVILSVLLLMALFTFVVFIKLKEYMYFWYFCYLIFTFIFVATIYNIPFRFFYEWNLNLWDIYNTYALFYSLMTVSLLIYSKSFLQLSIHAPFWSKVLTFMAAVKILCFILGVLFNESLTEVTGTNIFFHNPRFDFICLLPAYFIGVYRLFKGDKYAKYFVGAFSLIITGFIFHSFGLTLKYTFIKESSTGFVSNIFFDLIIIEVFLFTYGLAERFRLTKLERENALQSMIFQLEENAILKDKVNRELEEKVSERTKELKSQSEKIFRMNLILEKSNIKLVEDVKDISKARVTHKPVSFEEFKMNYPDESSCLHYLSNLKWGKGFTCRKCKNTSFIEGKTVLSHRCNKCWYDETPTIGTIFHKLKFPIEKAFYLLYLVTNKPSISIEELSTTLGLSIRTCWSYKNKITDAIAERKKKKKYDGSWDSIILNLE